MVRCGTLPLSCWLRSGQCPEEKVAVTFSSFFGRDYRLCRILNREAGRW
jgi:hypothetical protein